MEMGLDTMVCSLFIICCAAAAAAPTRFYLYVFEFINMGIRAAITLTDDLQYKLIYVYENHAHTHTLTRRFQC